MFSIVTALGAMGLNVQLISYIDRREFPGIEGGVPPGPLGYQPLIRSGVLTIIPDLMFFLNGWLADGLLVSVLSGIVFARLGV